MKNKSELDPKRWFYAFLFCHVLIWTIFPLGARFNLPLDSMEGATWGMQLQWGYDKDPLLNAWLTRLAMAIGGYHDWIIYFFSQLAVATGLIAIWQLAKKFLSPLQAVVAVMILEGAQYYNIAAIDFNDNVLQVMLWPILCLAFYHACVSQKYWHWLWVGATAALAFLAKYYVVMLLLPMLAFLIFNPQARQSWRQGGLYFAAVIFLLLITPHLIWLFQHQFLTLTYSFGQAKASAVFSDHFWQPVRFAWMQIVSFLLPALLMSTVLLGKQKVWRQEPQALDSFQWQFLYFIGIGPLIANMLYSAATGNSIHVLWGMPLLSLWGILLLALSQPLILPHRFVRLIVIIILLMLGAGAGYSYSLATAGNTSSANYPGREIAEKVTAVWHAQAQQPLKYIAGPRWLAGNIAFYSIDHPTVYMEANSVVTTWIDEPQLQQQGAVFVWEQGAEKSPPPEWLQRFPRLKVMPPIVVNWHRSDAQLNIGVAVLPPQ